MPDSRLLAGVVLLALLLRAGVFLAGAVPEASHDAVNYDAMTRRLLGEGVYAYKADEPNAYVTPGYPLFLAALYAVFGWQDGSPLDAVRWVQVGLGALTAGLLVLIGYRLASPGTGLAAGLVWALYPSLVFLPLHLLTETLFLFLIGWFTLLLLNALERGDLGWWAGAGAVLALATLVRPVTAPLLAVVWVWVVWHLRATESAADRVDGPVRLAGFGTRAAGVGRLVLVSAAAFVVVLAPWWIRNATVLGEVVLLATQTGNPLIAGAFPFGEVPPVLPTAVDEQFDQAVRQIIRGFKEQPVTYLYWFTAGKLLRMLGSPFYTPVYYDLAQFTHFLTIPIGIWGLVYGMRSRPGIHPGFQLIAWLAAVVIVLHLPFIPENRFGLPALPWLFLLGGLLVETLWRQGGGRHGGSDAGPDPDPGL